MGITLADVRFPFQMITSGGSVWLFRRAAISLVVGAMLTAGGCAKRSETEQARKDAIKQYLEGPPGKSGPAGAPTPEAKKKWPGGGDIKKRVLKAQ